MVQIDKAKIEKEAKEILDKFAHALEKVEKEKADVESYVDRKDFERYEISSESKDSEKSKNAAGADNNFKKRFLDNSPNHDDDFVIAEKGEWK